MVSLNYRIVQFRRPPGTFLTLIGTGDMFRVLFAMWSVMISIGLVLSVVVTVGMLWVN